LLLLGAILKFCCHVHQFVATLTLTTLPTSHITPTPPALSIFFKNIKVWELFQDPLYMLLIHTAEQLVSKYGIVASLILNPVRNLDTEGAYTIEKACCNDTVSRVIPRKEYHVTKLGLQMKASRKI
jgi:hypothetical protein